MLKYILLLIIAHSLFADYHKEFFHMDKSQINTLVIAYNAGGTSLAAMSWKESQAGKVRINLNKDSVDLGAFHLNSKSFLKRWYAEHDRKRSHYLDNVLLHKIMINDKYASKYAKKELNYWRIERNRSHIDTIKSYNCGNNIKHNRCYRYANDISQREKILKIYLPITSAIITALEYKG